MRRHALFIGLFVLIAAARFAILLASQTHVHSDEAIIGLMGKHILEGRYFPFYMYGQPYNAGAAWEAYLAANAFAFFGISVMSLKSCIVVLSLLCLFLFYRMCLALYDQRTSAPGHDCVCTRSVTSQMAFSSQRLLLVFLVDPNIDDAFCVDRISPGSETKGVVFLWASVRCEHLVPGACRSRWSAHSGCC